MLLAHRQESINRDPLMLTLRSESSGGQFGSLGVDWPLILQIGGWVITGIGLGWSVYESVRGGAEKAGVQPGDLSSSDISALATNIAAADPQGRSKQEWESTLTAMLGAGAAPIPTPQTCPTGYYRDPASGACLPVQKAGFFEDLGTGGTIALAAGALVAAKMLKLI